MLISSLHVCHAVSSEIAPPTIRGSIGVLNQLAIVFGIFGAQALGLALGQSGDWR